MLEGLSLVNEHGARHWRYPGGPIYLHVRIVRVPLCSQQLACLRVGVVEDSIFFVISCVVSQDYILLQKERIQETVKQKRVNNRELVSLLEKGRLWCNYQFLPDLGSPLLLVEEQQTGLEGQLGPQKHRPMWLPPSAAHPHSRLKTQLSAKSISFLTKLLTDVLWATQWRTVSNGLTCVDEVGVDVEPGGADAPWTAVGVGQAQVCWAQIAGWLCLGWPTAGEREILFKRGHN